MFYLYSNQNICIEYSTFIVFKYVWQLFILPRSFFLIVFVFTPMWNYWLQQFAIILTNFKSFFVYTNSLVGNAIHLFSFLFQLYYICGKTLFWICILPNLISYGFLTILILRILYNIQGFSFYKLRNPPIQSSFRTYFLFLDFFYLLQCTGKPYN